MKDNIRGRYDPLTALQNAGRLMGMELEQAGPGELCGPYYLNGERHAYRRDKLKVFISRGNVWVYEEGGRGVSLPQWLVEFGGAADFKDAIRMIKGERQSIVWSHDFRDKVAPEVRYVPMDVVRGSAGYDLNGCNLFRWMCGMFPEADVRRVWAEYNVTTDSHGNCVFWYVDQQGRVLYDKRIYYKEDGHRDKNFFPGRQYRVKDGYSGRCFFGACVPDDGKRSFVCESEKSALLGRLYYGRRFLAVGGKSNLHDVDDRMLLLPDMDARIEWEEKGEVWPWWEKWGVPVEEIPATADIGDMIVYKKSI